MTRDLARDLRYAVRGLIRRPAFAALCLFTIAVGTAALASVLSVVWVVLLRPAPYPTAARIVQIGQLIDGRDRSEVSTADVLALRESAPSLSRVTIAWFSDASIAGSGALPDRARLVYTDWQAFELLGVEPLLGRRPNARDEGSDAEPVVIIGHRLWAERFAGRRDAIGSTLRVDGPGSCSPKQVCCSRWAASSACSPPPGARASSWRCDRSTSPAWTKPWWTAM